MRRESDMARFIFTERGVDLLFAESEYVRDLSLVGSLNYPGSRGLRSEGGISSVTQV